MDRHVNELNLELQDLRENCGQVDDLRQDNEHLQIARKEFHNTYEDTLQEHQEKLSEEFSEREKLINEKQEMQR
jgi:hypothetical protein